MTGQLFFESSLTQTDPAILDAIKNEYHRQNDQIELIASENIVSKAVLEAQGTILTNKYAEGYSGKRYYGGCEHVDVVEDLCIERITKLFNAKFANVQVHSGSQANQAVFLALLKPGDTIMVLFPLVAGWIILVFLSLVWSRCVERPFERRVAILFCLSQKSLAMGLPMLQILSDGSNASFSYWLIPLVLFHFIQLLLGIPLIGFHRKFV